MRFRIVHLYLHTFICSSPSLLWVICNLCLYVNARAFVSIQRRMDAPNLIQNVWPGFRRICQRSIMLCKILTFGRLPSCCLLRWHRIVCWPIFRPRLSGIWCARCCRGTEHEFSPSCSVLWLWSAVFTPSCWFRLGCVHDWSPFCVHRCFFFYSHVHESTFSFVFVQNMSS